MCVHYLCWIDLSLSQLHNDAKRMKKKKKMPERFLLIFLGIRQRCGGDNNDAAYERLSAYTEYTKTRLSRSNSLSEFSKFNNYSRDL